MFATDYEKDKISEEQMVKILRQAENSPVSSWPRSTGSATSRSTPGASASGNSVLAERVMDIGILKEVAAKNGERVRPANKFVIDLRSSDQTGRHGSIYLECC
jgi:hypothetical protein